VIDCLDFQVADVPQFNKGLSIAETRESLGALAGSPLFAGEDGNLAASLAQGIADVLTSLGSDAEAR
jgi:hypothetical protein